MCSALIIKIGTKYLAFLYYSSKKIFNVNIKNKIFFFSYEFYILIAIYKQSKEYRK